MILKLGELVEILIRVHDSGRLSHMEDIAVCDACNILDQLPRGWTVEDARNYLKKLKETIK